MAMFLAAIVPFNVKLVPLLMIVLHVLLLEQLRQPAIANRVCMNYLEPVILIVSHVIINVKLVKTQQITARLVLISDSCLNLAVVLMDIMKSIM